MHRRLVMTYMREDGQPGCRIGEGELGDSRLDEALPIFRGQRWATFLNGIRSRSVGRWWVRQGQVDDGNKVAGVSAKGEPLALDGDLRRAGQLCPVLRRAP